MTKEKTPQNHQEGQAVPDPIFTANTVAELSQKWFEEWKPYLETDGEKLLGDVLATVLASMAQLREAQAVNSEGFSQVTNLIQELTARHRTTTQAISKRLEKLEGR